VGRILREISAQRNASKHGSYVEIEPFQSKKFRVERPDGRSNDRSGR